MSIEVSTLVKWSYIAMWEIPFVFVSGCFGKWWHRFEASESWRQWLHSRKGRLVYSFLKAGGHHLARILITCKGMPCVLSVNLRGSRTYSWSFTDLKSAQAALKVVLQLEISALRWPCRRIPFTYRWQWTLQVGITALVDVTNHRPQPGSNQRYMLRRQTHYKSAMEAGWTFTRGRSPMAK